MKKISLVTLIMFISVTFIYSQNSNSKEVKEFTCSVYMDCMSCKEKIEKNIAFEKGVRDLKVDFEKQTVTIKYRADRTSENELLEALSKLGYKAKVVELNDSL